MGRQTRTLREGTGENYEVVTLAQASSTKFVIANYGVTEMSSAITAADFVLAPPVRGVRKTIYSRTATTGVVIRGSTGVTVTFNAAGATQIKFDAAGDQVVELLGRNSTGWVVTSITPQTTALVIGTS